MAANPPAGGFQVADAPQAYSSAGRGARRGGTGLMRYTVYVLLNPEGKIYVGQTADLSRRLQQHNDPEFRGTLHTKRHPGPWRLVHEEQFPSRSAAMRRERELKSARGRDWVRQHLAGGC